MITVSKVALKGSGKEIRVVLSDKDDAIKALLEKRFSITPVETAKK